MRNTVFALVMNGSILEVEGHRMTDGSLLLSLDGSSHVTHMKEEVDKYRVEIGGKTCVFEKENDPMNLRSPSPGKLIQYFVEDGGHVDANQDYAEIESMKMIHNLCTSESGMCVPVDRHTLYGHVGTCWDMLGYVGTCRDLRVFNN